MLKQLFLLCCTIGFTITSMAQKNLDGTVWAGKTKREYTLHLPINYKAGTKRPLVMVFHGGSGTGKQVQQYMGMDAIADRDSFITVYPNGINKQWNDGRDFKESISAIDDVQFINQLLDTLQKYYAVDSSRIFATGISNGGFFSIYLSYKLSHRLLAVAPVCASIPARIWNEFYPANPISVMIMNGTADPLVPYNGGEVGNRTTGSRGICTATDSTVQRYIAINHTSSTPQTVSLPNDNKSDQCSATMYVYTGGNQNTKVCLVKVKNGGHTLPGASQYLPKLIVGRVCNDFNGNEMIWEFFRSSVPR